MNGHGNDTSARSPRDNSARSPRDDSSRPPFDVVFLDCDSTLSAIEGIDELARDAGVFPQVEQLTREAMDGTSSLESVYGRRLAIVRPTRAAIDALALRYVECVVPGADDLIAGLTLLEKRVHLISGGVLEALLPLAARLGIAEDKVHAVSLRFDANGAYAGFDEASPLARSGGKAETCREVLAQSGHRAAIVGDGKTDLEARPPCVAVIGFGGVVAREVMRAGADAWVEGSSILPVLSCLVTPDEVSRLASLGPDLAAHVRADAAARGASR